jgi:hypothetical protein
MIGAAIKHFGVVGLVFALVLGWLATMIVNTLLGVTMEWILGHRATDSYWVALLLTVVSLSLIGAATFLGNRVYRAGARRALSGGALMLSTMCYVALVALVVLPQVSEIIGPMMGHLSYAYQNPEVAHERALALTLPGLRMVILPACYLFAGLSATTERSS